MTAKDVVISSILLPLIPGTVAITFCICKSLGAFQRTCETTNNILTTANDGIKEVAKGAKGLVRYATDNADDIFDDIKAITGVACKEIRDNGIAGTGANVLGKFSQITKKNKKRH
jgi:hypothetical protein